MYSFFTLFIISGCKGTNKREQYKAKKRFFCFLLSSDSTFDAVKGANKRGKNQNIFGVSHVNSYLCAKENLN